MRMVKLLILVIAVFYQFGIQDEALSKSIFDTILDKAIDAGTEKVNSEIDRQADDAFNKGCECRSSGNPETSKLDRIAVLAQGKYKDIHRLIEDEFFFNLQNKRYTIVIRNEADIGKILQEIGFQGSALTEAAIAKIGKILNVPAILIVEVTQLDRHRAGSSTYLKGKIGARLIDVQEARLLWLGKCTSEVSSTSRRNDLVSKLAECVSQKFPSR